MLNNKIVFARFMALLKSIDPDVPLPAALEDYLWTHMEVEKIFKKALTLEKEGQAPAKAYYVVRGFVIVYGFDEKLDRYVMRIYRENTIVALNCFIKQLVSVFTIEACKGALLWSITDEKMQEIYEHMEGMESLALSTALKYGEAKENARASLLAMDIEARVLKFYQRYKGLLPPKKNPIRDACIACFLSMTINVFRKNRRKLRNKGLLKY